MNRKSGTKNDDVYRQLRRQCITSDLAPGQQLVELDIAAAMKCSQSTVREALLRLQEEGLIVRQGYRGTVVTELTPDEAEVFMDLRVRLEVESVRRALARLRPEDLGLLVDIIRDMEAVAERGDSYALFERELDFHSALLQIAGLPALQRVLTLCSVCIHRIKIAQSERLHSLRETAGRHWDIIRALEAGDADDIERVMRQHISALDGRKGVEFRPGPVKGSFSPDMRRVFEGMQAEDRGLPDISTLPPAEARAESRRRNARWNEIDRDAYHIVRFTIPAQPRALDAVQITPRGVVPVGTVFHVHGGGWVTCDNETHLGAMTRLADASGCTVIGVDYGLAPEALFPQGLNDCGWAWRWLRATSAGDAGRPEPWFVAGDSSGANIALAMLVDLKSLGEVLPAAAALFYGVYGPDEATESYRQLGTGEFGLSTERMAWYRRQYLGPAGDARDPRHAPLLADLSGLPPLFITAAGLDPLRDDTIALAGRLAHTNTPFEFKLYEGVVHGFMQMGSRLPEARAAFSDAAAFLARHS
jgi:acetyl esterase/lipase/DNA-binding GntR family transcriptional regulator